MVKIIDYSLIIPETEFPKRFTDREAVQNILNKLLAEQAGLLKNFYDHLEDQPKEQINYQKDKTTLASMEEIVPMLTKNLEEATNEEVIKKLTAELSKAKMTRDRLRDKLARRDEADLTVDQLKHQNNQLIADSFDAWADKIGNWFSTGAVGPGTVTYKDKTYTAQ